MEEAIKNANKIIIIQAENPDGDSIGSSLALEEILGSMGKEIILYCPVDIPKYLHYIKGWDRIVSDFETSSDLAIIVDTQADILLSKTYETPGARHYLETHPVIVIDHHETASDLAFNHTLICETAASTSEVIYRLAEKYNWDINQQAAENMLVAILSDTLGLTTQSSSADTFLVASKLVGLGASSAEIEGRRREFMKKSPEILKYKGELLERIEYHVNGKLGLVHIPWEEIQTYSDQYNPSVLVLDEVRMVNGVEVAIAVKTYPDGKLTGKIRANAPVADAIAGYFGGGGHKYAAGFRIYQSYDETLDEIIKATNEVLEKHETEII